jgi:SDR family mycofactocin-dependent oxidoreductase
MGRVEGKVALITGAARGQGRSHAVGLAAEGADIIAVDICEDLSTIPYPMATPEDLALTTKMVEDLDRRIISRKADTRDLAALKAVVDEAVSEFGTIDILCANAGGGNSTSLLDTSEENWDEVIELNLTGVWKAIKAVAPVMVDKGRGGSIIITSSVSGLAAYPNLGHYNSAKHGLVGLMKSAAVELAPHQIRCNTIHPTTCNTPAFNNEFILRLFCPGVENPTIEDARALARSFNALPIGWVEARDITNAVIFLASDESRYLTGVQLPIDAGATAPFKIAHG